MLSIESQYAELEKVFTEQSDIQVVGVFREAASAKAPGRPIFNQMIDRIERGEAEGILAWHPDRLARNSVDGGRIIYLLDRRALKSLRFATFTFENNPQGKFMLSITFGYSKYYVDSLSENVKRGNRTKIEKGWRPNMAPLGYLNDKETKTIVKDPLHFPLIRQMFELMLTGIYGPKDVALKARDEWGFRTPRRKRIGGTPLALSSIYKMLSNPFYAGVIEWAGQTFPGKHEPIVTLDEFERVQALLRKPGRPRSQGLRFAFTGMIRCGACGLMVTAENKTNTRYGYRYTYYHCTKRRLDPRCPQPCVELTSLEQQIADFLQQIDVPPHVHQVALAQLRDDAHESTKVQDDQVRSIEQSRRETTKQLQELTGLRLRNLLDDAEYVARRKELQHELLKLEQTLKTRQTTVDRFEPLDDTLFFRSRAVEWFVHGDASTKKLILETVGSNLTLRDKILSIRAKKPFVPIPRNSYLRTVLGSNNDDRNFSAALREFVDEMQRALDENPEEAAIIRHNVRMLKSLCEEDLPKAA